MKHHRVVNFCAPLNFMWVIIALFIFTQLDDLCVYAIINFAHWQNKKYC